MKLAIYIRDLNWNIPKTIANNVVDVVIKPDIKRYFGEFADKNIEPDVERIIWIPDDNDNIWKIGMESYHWSPKKRIISSSLVKYKKTVIGNAINEIGLIIFKYWENRTLVLSWNLDSIGCKTGVITNVIFCIGNCINLYDFS